MEQLLTYKSIPIEIEVNVRRGELRQTDQPRRAPSVRISGGRPGGGAIEAEPVNLKVDLSKFDTFTQGTPQSSSDGALKFTYQGTARIADNGGRHGEAGQPADLGARPEEITAKKASRTIESILGMLPKNKNSDISYSDGKLNIKYDYDADVPEDFWERMQRWEFIPAKIEVEIKQMPKLEIEYTGGPIYFPLSASPDYEPAVDIFA